MLRPESTPPVHNRWSDRDVVGTITRWPCHQRFIDIFLLVRRRLLGTLYVVSASSDGVNGVTYLHMGWYGICPKLDYILLSCT